MELAFKNDGLWCRYRAELTSWVGTPYRHLQCVKGRGADCALFIGAALHAAGIMLEMHPPQYYAKDWYRTNQERDIIKDTLLQHFRDYTPAPYQWRLLDPAAAGGLERGDALLFSMQDNGITNHVAVYMGNKELCHSVIRKTVILSTYVRFWERYLVGVFRLYVEK